MECEKETLRGPLIRLELEKIDAIKKDLARIDGIVLAARDHVRQRRLAGPIRPHDRGDFAVLHGEVQIDEDFPSINRNIQILDFKHDGIPRRTTARSPAAGSAQVIYIWRRVGIFEGLRLEAGALLVLIAWRQPTLPSSEIAINFCASTANSIGKLLKDIANEAIDDQSRRFFGRKPALHAIEQLVFGYFRSRRFMFELRARVLRFDVGHRMRAAGIADQKRIAIGEIARARRLAMRRDLAAIGILGRAPPQCPSR